MPGEGANLIDEDKASNGAAATLFRSLIHCTANTHAASGLHTSDAEQFTAAVPERSGPTDWRGGLERSDARRGRVGGWRRRVFRGRAIPRPRYAREKNKAESRWSRASVALSGIGGVENRLP
jgi:hypothetical protein